MSSYNILNPFSEKVKQIQASIAASNLLCERSLDGTKLYEENIMLIESKTYLTRMEIKEQFQEYITFCRSGSLLKEILVHILKSILPEKNVQIAADQIFGNVDKDGKDDIDLPSLLLDVIFSTLLLLRKRYTEFSNCLILTNQDSSS